MYTYMLRHICIYINMYMYDHNYVYRHRSRVNLHVNIIIVVAMLSRWWFRVSEEKKRTFKGMNK